MNLKEILSNSLEYMGEESSDIYVGAITINYSRLPSMANAAVSDIIGAHDWSFLKKTHSISIVDGTELYDLPFDYSRMIVDTMYVNYIKIEFPATDKSISRNLSCDKNQARIIGGKLQFTRTNPGTVTFDYISSSVVLSSIGQGQSRFLTDFDEWQLDDELLMRSIRHRYALQVGDPSAGTAASDVQVRIAELKSIDTGTRSFNSSKSQNERLSAPHMAGLSD